MSKSPKPGISAAFADSDSSDEAPKVDIEDSTDDDEEFPSFIKNVHEKCDDYEDMIKLLQTNPPRITASGEMVEDDRRAILDTMDIIESKSKYFACFDFCDFFISQLVQIQLLCLLQLLRLLYLSPRLVQLRLLCLL